MFSVKRITTVDAIEFSQVDELYESAFPYHEKREKRAKACALAAEQYFLTAWYKDETFIGLIGSWHFDNMTYIEHLAISSSCRSQGYGKQILEQFLQQQTLTVLEIDPLTTEIANRRWAFYQGLGCKRNNFSHHHPAYHKELADHELVVLSYPDELSQRQYADFTDQLKQVVMAF